MQHSLSEFLPQILFRLGSGWADLDVLSSDEVACWPEFFWRVLQQEGILVPSGLAFSVDCDACYEGHAEPVETVEEPEETRARHYIVCPEVGRVQVDPARLRQWRLDQGGLARALARLLLTRGQPRENARSSLWELGNVELSGTVHDVVLAKNGARIGDGELLKPAGTGWVNPIILVMAGAPVQAAGAIVVPLVRVLSVDEEGLVLDRRYLEAIAGQGISAQPQSQSQYIFRKEGDYWTVGFGGPPFSLKHLKGLEYIGYLIVQSGRAVPVLELFHLGKVPADLPHATSLLRMNPEDLAEQGLGVSDLGNGDPVLDAQAMQEYSRRLHEIEAELGHANESEDDAMVEVLEEEQKALIEELKASTGFGGRSRKTSSGVERARSNVRVNISNAVGHIGRWDKELAHHLKHSIKTGRLCSYEPETRPPWTL